MVKDIWYSLEEALPPFDKEFNCSVEVAIVLKSGDVQRGFRYYTDGPSCWAIFDGKDTEVRDEDIVAWSRIPSF